MLRISFKLIVALICGALVCSFSCSVDKPPTYFGQNATIGPEGGTLFYEDGDSQVIVDIPSGALDEPVHISIREHSEIIAGSMGRTFELCRTIQASAADIPGREGRGSRPRWNGLYRRLPPDTVFERGKTHRLRCL